MAHIYLIECSGPTLIAPQKFGGLGFESEDMEKVAVATVAPSTLPPTSEP